MEDFYEIPAEKQASDLDQRDISALVSWLDHLDCEGLWEGWTINQMLALYRQGREYVSFGGWIEEEEDQAAAAYKSLKA